MPFFNMQRSFRVCVHARVAMHAYESGRKCIHVRNKTFFEGMLVENEPPCGESWLRACYGYVVMITPLDITVGRTRILTTELNNLPLLINEYCA